VAAKRRPERRRRPEGGRARPGSPRARLFVALDLPDPVRRSIAAWRDRSLTGRDDLRPVAPEALHVTLCFLGWRAEKEVPLIAETAFGACAAMPAPLLTARAIEPIPPRRPRLFALDLAEEEGAASAIQAAISEALAGERLYEPEARPFWPHLTLARVKRGVRAAPVAAPPPPAEPFETEEVTLYRSTLRPQGALYEPLAQARLGRG
jgi:RNA 2',3'-cyclic 3'-phosphodiesterase